MISTPYFDKLQKLAVKSSRIRSQNNRLSVCFSRNGFSTSEINNITETESFIIPRISDKKPCSICGKFKSYSCFRKDTRLKIGLKSYCRICGRNHYQSKEIRKKANSFYWKKRATLKMLND